MTGLVGSNAVIHRMVGTGRRVVCTSTRRGPVYHFDDALYPIRAEVVKRLVDKGILVACRDSNSDYALSSSWGGVAQ